MKPRENIITIKKEDARKCIELLEDYSGNYKTYQLYKKDFDLERIKAAGASIEFLKIAENFVGKRNILFHTQLRKMADLFEKDELEFLVIPIDETNVDTFNLPDDSLVSLEVNLDNMTPQNLQALQRRIQGCSKPIHNITLLGAQNNAGTRAFIESLYNVELINTDNKEVAELANQITHRNHLIWALEVVVVPDTDPWPEIIKKLSKVPPYLSRDPRGYQPTEKPNRLYCRKFMAAIECYQEYGKTLKKLYGIQEDEAEELPSKKYEYHNTINGCITATGDLFFEKMLENLDESLRANGLSEFEINIDLSDDNLRTLTDWVKKQNNLPFRTLTLQVNKDLKNINELLAALKEKSITTLELVFPSVDNELDIFLADNLEVDGLDYIIQIKKIRNTDGINDLSSKHLTRFSPKMIEAYQAYHKAVSIEDSLIPVEFVAVEQEQAQEVTELRDEVQQQEQQQDYASFDGELVDRIRFEKAPYADLRAYRGNNSKPLTRRELFGDLPNAIKYLSHEAAVYIARNETAFSSFNIDESVLPQGMQIKKTPKGELILDYDCYAIAKPDNVFIPKPLKNNPHVERLFEDVYDKKDLEEFITRKDVFESFNLRWFTAIDFTNLLVRFDIGAINNLMNKIGEVEDKHPGFTQFLCKKYLGDRAQIESLLEGTNFLDSIDKIKNYDAIKYKCLQKFLAQTGDSKTDLKDITDAFEVFWDEYLQLCDREQIQPDKILEKDWNTVKITYHEAGGSFNEILEDSPIGANPVVYMYRMLTILKNARSVSEQLEHLDGIVLDNYGPYYASRYEGLKLVTKEMNLYPIGSFEDQCVKGVQALKIAMENAATLNDVVVLEEVLQYGMRMENLGEPHYKEGPDYQEEPIKTIAIAMGYNTRRSMSDLLEKVTNWATSKLNLDTYGQRENKCIEIIQQLSLVYSEEIMGALKKNGVDLEGLGKNDYNLNLENSNAISAAICAKSADNKVTDQSTELFLADLTQSFAESLKTSQSPKAMTADISPLEIYKEFTSKRPSSLPDEVDPLKIYENLVSAAKAERGPNSPVYKVELEDLYKFVENGQDFEKFTELTYRFLGCQQHGPKMREFTQALEAYKSSTKNPDPKVILTLLFFISHSRYEGTTRLTDLLDSITKQEVSLDQINRELLGFYKSDIKLSDREGLLVLQMLGDKEQGLPVALQLFDLLKTDKYAALNMLSAPIAKGFVGAMKSVEHFLKDPSIGFSYKNELPLFCALLGASNVGGMDEIAVFLAKAASSQKPNNLDAAFHLVTNSRTEFTESKILEAFKVIDKLTTYDKAATLSILKDQGFVIKEGMPSLVTKESQGVKQALRCFIYAIKKCQNGSSILDFGNLIMGPDEYLKKTKQDLESAQDLSQKSSLREKVKELEKDKEEWDKAPEQTSKELQEELNKVYNDASWFVSAVGGGVMQLILGQIRNGLIEEELDELKEPLLKEVLLTKLYTLSSFNVTSFEALNQIKAESTKLVQLFGTLEKSHAFKSDPKRFTSILEKLNFSMLDYTALYKILTSLSTMAERNYLDILEGFVANKALITNKDTLDALLANIEVAHKKGLPSNYIKNLISLLSKDPSNLKGGALLVLSIVEIFNKDNADELLKFINKNIETLSFNEIESLVNAVADKDATSIKQIAKLASDLHAKKPSELNAFLGRLNASKNSGMVLEIVAKSHAKDNTLSVSYTELVASIEALGADNIAQLLSACEITAPNTFCLFSALETRDPKQPFDEFLARLEREPFGPRDLSKQFDISQVERVINESRDRNNKTIYTYRHRKQLMESFQFVNAAGEKLPIYKGKAAKDLSNKEIRELFTALKGTNPTHNQRLYVLALMREAMYRTTGQQPNSTQMIAIIDCMMHKADVISNIDTGQGKSLIDVMKASLLWLDGRSDMTTSSLTDARRDIANYFPYLDSLGIPNGKKPVTSTSAFRDFQQDGVNISTFPQLSLFYAKAVYDGNEIESDHASLIIGESDHAILEDLVIYRYATTKDAPVKFGEEWVYYGINSYIDANFKHPNKKVSDADIKSLREHLEAEATKNKRMPARINEFDDAQLRRWLDAAYTVKFRLRENYQYHLSEDKEEKEINGMQVRTRVARIIMKDGRISPDTQYGNGIQQLLYARLNTRNRNTDFVIEPESKTMWSSNNKNLIDYYRGLIGFIWGSSATVGSSRQVREQYEDYGFEFSEIKPHHKNIVKIHEPLFVEAAEHFEAIIQTILSRQKLGKNVPAVYCKDIITAKALHEKLSREHSALKTQLFTGSKNEGQVIANARLPNMITITTKALGRNTNIAMGEEVLDIIQTFPDSESIERQIRGRTGRYGKPGNVFAIYSKDDLGGKTVEEFQKMLDEKAKAEREHNQRLYDAIGHFGKMLKQIDTPDKKELLAQWASCRDAIEKRYDLLKQDEDFNSLAIQIFKAAFRDEQAIQQLTLEQLAAATNKKHEAVEKYKPYTEDVKISDCIPASIIAYNILDDKALDSKINAAEVNENLTKLFDGIRKGEVDTSNALYLQYLSKSEQNLKSLKEHHSNFIKDILKSTAKIPRFKRWIGFESELSKIANDRNYLLMFKVFADKGGGPIAELEEVKTSIVALLDNYLETSWFISKSRREETNSLKDTIGAAGSVEDVMKLLGGSKGKVFNEDLESDKRRLFKSINYFGSRFQNTLNSALSLTSALTGQKQAPDLIPSLLSTIGINEKPSTFDALQLTLTSHQASSPTTGIIIKNIKAVSQEICAHHEGMEGRGPDPVEKPMK